MDGIEGPAADQVDEDLRDVPVMMYSADADRDHRNEAMRLGARDFLEKGTVGVDRLIARISELAHEPPVVQ
jgi:DNA-binding NarL/FixJ family response regulator